MELVRITKENEQPLVDQMKGKALEYYWFIADWQDAPEKCDICLAMDDGRIRGGLLVFDKRFSQLRGDQDSVSILAKKLTDEKFEGSTPMGMERYVLEQYEPDLTFTTLLLHLKRPEVTYSTTVSPDRLSLEDAEAVVKVMFTADPRVWGNTRLEDIRGSIKDGYWVGVREGGDLVAIGGSSMQGDIPNISTIAVLEPYRNKGYARSMVSTILGEIFKTRCESIIHVREDNAPARRAYESVGYKERGRHTFIRGRRRT